MNQRAVHARVCRAALLSIAALSLLGVGSALAAFSAGHSVPANSFSTATVAPPSALTLTAACSGSAIALRSTSTATGSGTSLTVSKPTATTTGDLLVAQVTVRGSGAIAAPLGWTVIQLNDLEGSQNQASFWKLAGSSEPASYTFTTPNARNAVGIAAFSGVNQTLPINASAAATGTGTTASAPSVTTTVANTRLIVLIAIRQLNGSTPTGMTALWKIAGPGGSAAATADGYSQAISAAGSTGVRTSSWSGTANWIAHSIALRPAHGPRVVLSWTASPSTATAGYTLQRFVLAIKQQEWTVTPRTAVSYTDDTVAGGTTYTYTLRAFAGTGTWVSDQLSGSVTAPLC